MPLAVATPDLLGAIRLNWVHGNHLGVPLATTDAGGNPATTPNDYLAPGFPGQSRVLPDLYYNRYRDYDPATGRYIQADPIGLSGGSNVFLYAAGNPINLTDPIGLVPLSEWPTYIPKVGPKEVPGGPWTPATGPNDKPGKFFGPPRRGKPRLECYWMPPRHLGGHPHAPFPYWKVKDPDKPWQRYSLSGRPISAEEAHPRPKWTRPFGGFGGGGSPGGGASEDY
jgi:RHS repeat-associated protein